MTSRKALVLAGAACLTLAAALGVLFARPVLAQFGGNATALRVATLPRQSELWRLTLDYPGATWEHTHDDEYGSHWFMWFTVQATGRRPVVTDVDPNDPSDSDEPDGDHVYNVKLTTHQGILQYRTFDGSWKSFSFRRVATAPYEHLRDLEAHNGHILPPGHYRMEVTFSGIDGGQPWIVTDPAQEVIEHEFNVVGYYGYWAEP
ncbi:MAG: hypothetical protein HRF45_02465 [Fimbriimonadia bacterium]